MIRRLEDYFKIKLVAFNSLPIGYKSVTEALLQGSQPSPSLFYPFSGRRLRGQIGREAQQSSKGRKRESGGRLDSLGGKCNFGGALPLPQKTSFLLEMKGEIRQQGKKEEEERRGQFGETYHKDSSALFFLKPLAAARDDMMQDRRQSGMGGRTDGWRSDRVCERGEEEEEAEDSTVGEKGSAV